MHEVHLMRQIVNSVDHALREASGGKPLVVRVRVSALSHLANHDLSTLQSAFDLASLGTRIEGASLDVVTVPVRAHCRSCGLTSNTDRLVVSCNVCGSMDVDLEEVPEVLVQDVVVAE